MHDQMTQAERIRKLRSIAGMNRREFSRFLGIPYRTIQDWEGEKRHTPEYVLSLIQYRVCSEYECNSTD